MIDNLRAERPTFVSHLECSLTGESSHADRLAGLSEAGKPLLVRYNLPAVARAVSKGDLKDRAPDMWRYRELLPVRETRNIVSLGEMMTPVIRAPRTALALGVEELWVKDEGRLPTGSFKARGLSVAVSMAKAFGVRRLAIPSAGNAGVALAAYCARAEIEAFVFYADDPPRNPASDLTVCEIPLFGAHAYAVKAVISDIGPLIERYRSMDWFNMATFKEPYRLEGKKTIAFELAEQFEWDLPEVIFYPTGGGTGLVAMWKAFDELEALGWIGSKRPRLFAVQSQTCAPIVRAFREGTKFAEPWKDGYTSIPGVRVPATIGDFLILNALRESGGGAMAIDDSKVEEARREMAAADGVHLCPEGAALVLACDMAQQQGLVGKSERVLLFNSASGMKYRVPFEKRVLAPDEPMPLSSSKHVQNTGAIIKE
jgi:threonine synthase